MRSVRMRLSPNSGTVHFSSADRLFPSAALRLLLVGVILVLWSLCPGAQTDCGAADQAGDRIDSELAAEADRAYDQGRFADAVRLYGSALRITPKAGAIHYRRAMAYEMLDRTSHAVADYVKAIELNPRDFKAMENLAGIYERDGGHVSEAMSLYKRALELDPRAEWKENLSVWIAMLQSRERGEETSAVAAWHLGIKRALSGDLKGALTKYSAAAELDPGMYQSYYCRALVRLRMGDVPAALQDLNTTIELCPTLRGALVLRGLLHERTGRNAGALMDLRRATRVDPRDPQAHYELGRMLEKEMEPADALQSYQEALRLRPKPELRRMVLSRMPAVKSSPTRRFGKRQERSGIMKEMW